MNKGRQFVVASSLASLIAPTVFAAFDAWSRGSLGPWVAVGFVTGFIPVGIATMPLLSAGHVGLGDWGRYLAWCLPFGVLGTVTAIAMHATLAGVARHFSRPV